MTEFIPRKILVTGAAGFIMSHVVDCLLSTYPEVQVIVLDVMDYCSSEKNLEAAFTSGRCKLYKGDICNFDLVRLILSSEMPDSIIHGAAVSHVDLSFGDSLKFTQVNTIGTHVMLEAMKMHNETEKTSKIERFIYICTDEVYGSVDSQCHENSIKQPTNPYSASKAAASLICNSYIESFGLPIIETRGNNTIGIRQYPEKLIPKFVSLLLDHRPLPIHGNGTAMRSLIDVQDCARAIVTILSRGKIHEVYNIEAGVEMSVLDITKTLLRKFGIPEEKWDCYIKYVNDRAFNDKRYFIDGSKLRNLGFEPKVDLEESLDIIVKWYSNNREYWPNTQGALEAHPKLSQYMK